MTMNIDVSVHVPDYVLWGGLLALLPFAVWIVVQLLLCAVVMSAMSLGGNVRFSGKTWLMVALCLVAAFVVGAASSAIFHQAIAGLIASMVILLVYYLVARCIDRHRQR